ncbi:MAG: hypothetical protein KBD85_04460, partial [Elusimicrobia bacterium]|nr:hypothetical protein [Elusimicrobiota bacterium]
THPITAPTIILGQSLMVTMPIIILTQVGAPWVTEVPTGESPSAAPWVDGADLEVLEALAESVGPADRAVLEEREVLEESVVLAGLEMVGRAPIGPNQKGGAGPMPTFIIGRTEPGRRSNPRLGPRPARRLGLQRGRPTTSMPTQAGTFIVKIRKVDGNRTVEILGLRPTRTAITKAINPT